MINMNQICGLRIIALVSILSLSWRSQTLLSLTLMCCSRSASSSRTLSHVIGCSSTPNLATRRCTLTVISKVTRSLLQLRTACMNAGRMESGGCLRDSTRCALHRDIPIKNTAPRMSCSSLSEPLCLFQKQAHTTCLQLQGETKFAIDYGSDITCDVFLTKWCLVMNLLVLQQTAHRIYGTVTQMRSHQLANQLNGKQTW